jgi:hypothetical protein
MLDDDADCAGCGDDPSLGPMMTLGASMSFVLERGSEASLGIRGGPLAGGASNPAGGFMLAIMRRGGAGCIGGCGGMLTLGGIG